MMERIRVGLVGAGNCASALVQGVEFYRDAGDGSDIPGLMHARLGGYHVSDIDISCAFDVDADKVGVDLSKALQSGHNNTIQFAEVPETGVIVSRGPTLDGLGRYYRQEIVESPAPPVDVAKVLRDTKTQILVNYLPVGSERAAKFYAEQALEAGVGFVNCMPVFIASHPAWAARFAEQGTPLIGDDVKSQVGSTIIHRVLAKLFEDRGVHLDPGVGVEVPEEGELDAEPGIVGDGGRLPEGLGEHLLALGGDAVDVLAPHDVGLGEDPLDRPLDLQPADRGVEAPVGDLPELAQRGGELLLELVAVHRAVLQQAQHRHLQQRFPLREEATCTPR